MITSDSNQQHILLGYQYQTRKDNSALEDNSWNDTPSHVRNLPDAHDTNNYTTVNETLQNTTIHTTQNACTSTPPFISYHRDTSEIQSKKDGLKEIDNSNLIFSTVDSIILRTIKLINKKICV
jgi:hypothetical protein